VYLVDEGGRGDAVVAMARALRMVHSLDPKGCPFSYPVEGKVTVIEEALGVNGPDPSGLREGIPAEELGFTHGDYCLPNVLVAEGGLGGVIDWDCGGLADRYVDFVSAVGSLGYNFGVGEAEGVWAPLFFEEYGVELDRERFRYYWRVNELLD
jgi:aminoglycoside phosphotransferase